MRDEKTDLGLGCGSQSAQKADVNVIRSCGIVVLHLLFVNSSW